MNELLTPQFAEQLAALPGSPATQALRREAWQQFCAVGFPHRKQEAWRYTDLKPITSANWALAAPAPTPEALAEVAAMLDTSALGNSCARLVFVDGQYAAALSSRSATIPGLEILTETTPAALPRSSNADPSTPPHALALLNAALTQQRIVLRVAAGCEVPAPLHVIFSASSRAQAASHPRVSVELAPGAALTLVEHSIDCPQSSGWMNLVTDATIGEHARLSVYRLQEHSVSYLHTELMHVSLNKEATLEIYSIDLGGQLVRNDIDISLLEEGARADLHGLFVAQSAQHIDNHTCIDHAAPATRSTETFRGIVGDKGRGVFNGKVIVRPGAHGTDAKQKSDNLLLSPRGEIDTKPELEIYTDDVKCSHGATVGEIDAEQLFYLRSRGIDEPTARGLLTFAFANTVLRRLALEELRQRVARRVGGALSESAHWDEMS